MEALADLGIARDAMQVIGFVLEGAKLGKAIYETGCFDANLSTTADELTKCIERLDKSLQHQPSSPSDDEVELLKVAQATRASAANLNIELSNGLTLL